MAKTETVCSCGAAYDSAGVCTRCGKKRPRSAGYRIFHGVLCILAALLLLFCINCTAFVRHQLKYRRLTKALRNEVRLSDASAPFGSETVADYIRREYVSDEAVTADDVAAAVDGMKLPAFAADKLEAYADMLRGKTDKVVKVQPDEVIAQLESSEKDLYSKNLLIIATDICAGLLNRSCSCCLLLLSSLCCALSEDRNKSNCENQHDNCQFLHFFFLHLE